jgi:secondary thiamine-phosphate synthase enzyme
MYPKSQESSGSTTYVYKQFSFPHSMHHTIVIHTTQSNLSTLQPEMKDLIKGNEVFHLEDITDQCTSFITKQGSGILHITTQHTTTSLLLNEVHEPMLILDLYKKTEEIIPNVLSQYFHNSKYRTKNRETCNTHCDTNGAAHVKAMIVGQPQVSIPFENNNLLLGKWQRIAFLDFDGPQQRTIILSILSQQSL